MLTHVYHAVAAGVTIHCPCEKRGKSNSAV
jgi:hypothetical protein